MSRRKKKRQLQGTITRHHGYWCLRYRERIRVGDNIKTVQRSKRLAPIDTEHKTRTSVASLAENVLEPISKLPRHYLAFRLGDFVERSYLPFAESKRKPSTYRGYKQMWLRYLKPRCADLVMHTAETRMIQQVLDKIEAEDKLGPQTMAHIKHLLGGVFHFAIQQGYLPKGTCNPVTCAETSVIPDFDGRAYTLEEIALMLSVLPEPARTVVAVAAFTGMRVGEIRGLVWDGYEPGDENSPGHIRVLHSIWRGRIGDPKTKRSKAPVPLIPQLQAVLERHREAMGHPNSGPIFASGAQKALDLDSLYRRQMKEKLQQAGIEWEGWHGFRRGISTNLERLGVRDSINALILRQSNDRVTRKHYIKPCPIETHAAMRLLSDAFSNVGGAELLPKIAPQTPPNPPAPSDQAWVQ